MNQTRFRPTDIDKVSTGGSKFLGFLPVSILNYEDRSSEFNWADVFLSITLQSEGSQYTTELKIVGSYDREDNGNIQHCTLLKRLYWFFDLIGFEGGPNLKGDIVDADGNKIDNLEKFLHENYLVKPNTPDIFKYYAYIYKEQGKKDKSKSYTTVYPRLVENTDSGRKELEGYVNFLKSKNIIKEAEQTPFTPNKTETNGAMGTTTQF